MSAARSYSIFEVDTIPNTTGCLKNSNYCKESETLLIRTPPDGIACRNLKFIVETFPSTPAPPGEKEEKLQS